MISLLFRIGVVVILIYLSIQYIPGINLIAPEESWNNAFGILAVLFVISELIVYPILKIIILPLSFLTLGLASIILSLCIIYFIEYIYGPFVIENGIAAILLCFVLGIIRTIIK